jgi:two-component system CitB family sensor kinase
MSPTTLPSSLRIEAPAPRVMAANADGYVELGRLCITGAIQPTINLAYGTSLGLDDPSRLVGTPLAEAGLPGSFPGLLAAATPASPAVEQVVGPHVLILSARAVRPAGPGLPGLGWVVLVRDRPELQSLTRQLDAVGALSTALRAQRHEFANRLHTITGLLALGDTDEARRYVAELTETGPLTYPAEQTELLRDPYLQAFLGAKSVEAAERGVHGQFCIASRN